MKATLLILLFSIGAAAQSLVVQGGGSLTHGQGDRAGFVIEGRVTSRWLYTRLSYAGTPKAYLGNGSIVTGDAVVTVPYRSAWFGPGFEVAHAKTRTYEKDAYRLLLGGGRRRGDWDLAVFAYPPEWGTPNRSFGARAEVTWSRQWIALTVRPFVQHHRDSLLPISGNGGGVDVLVGVRLGRVQ